MQKLVKNSSQEGVSNSFSLVNIVNMDFPDTYMVALADTQIAEQKIQETQFLKVGEETLGLTIELEANIDK